MLSVLKLLTYISKIASFELVCLLKTAWLFQVLSQPRSQGLYGETLGTRLVLASVFLKMNVEFE